jgi:hypothetical protein
MDDDTFIQVAGEIKLLVSLRFQDQIVDPDHFQHIRFKRATVGRVGDITPTYLPKDRFLRDLYLADPKIHTAALSAMMNLKTAVGPRKASVSDKEKAFKSITLPSKISDETALAFRSADGLWRRCINKYLDTYLLDDEKAGYEPLFSIPTGGSQRYFLPESEGLGKTSTPSKSSVPQELRALHHPAIIDLYNLDPEGFTTRLFTGVEDGRTLKDVPEPLYSREQPLQWICFLGKTGGKQRVVTIPCTVLNQLSVHQAEVLTALEKRSVCQGVFPSHENALRDIQRHLAKNDGKRLFGSIDSTSFTDRLPYYEVQRPVLEELYKRSVIEQIDLAIMDLICSAPTTFDNRVVVNYGTGTPMGTRPSFPLCSITNELLGFYAFCIGHSLDPAGVDPRSLPLRVIGDDFVTWDNRIITNYPKLLNDVGIESASDKCIISRNYAEMCSKIVSADGIYPQKKLKSPWRNGKDPDHKALLEHLSSLLSYYGEESQVMTPMILNSDPLLMQMQFLPEPFGLGWDLTQLEEEERVALLAFARGSRIKEKPGRLLPDALDSQMRRRRNMPPLTEPTVEYHNELLRHVDYDPLEFASYMDLCHLMTKWKELKSLDDFTLWAQEVEECVTICESRLGSNRQLMEKVHPYLIRDEPPGQRGRGLIPIPVDPDISLEGLSLVHTMRQLSSHTMEER